MCQLEEKGKKDFADKMQDPAFVVDMLSDAGVNKPPCHFCQMQGACQLIFGDSECKYVLHLESTVDLERKYVDYVAEHRQQLLLRKPTATSEIPQFSRST